MSVHKYDQGVIGNCAYMAHINTKAEVVWLCWPKFDSSFIFGKLLDEDKGGYFAVSPADTSAKSKQYYLENTNLLATEFDCKDGRFRVIDFAPRFYNYERYFKPLMLFRRIELLEGQPRISVKCQPRGEYGNKIPETQLGSNHIRYSGLGAEVRLTSDVPLNYILSEQEFILTQHKALVLSYGVPLEAPLESVVDELMNKTIKYWQRWVKYSNIPHFAQEKVIRSALLLKMHQYEDTGAVIAASTTSLPEHPGSGRNWDYRYCWIRDTFYTLAALRNIGQGAELEGYAHYLQNIAMNVKDRFAPVYSIIGDENFEEQTLELKGYLGNGPVRIGNQAKEHIQNDVYGQILVSLLPLYVDARFVDERAHNSVTLINRLLDLIDATMDEPDAGLWEFRNLSQKHAYTFLFHWAGSASAKKIGKLLGNNSMVEKADRLMKEAAQQIEACYDENLQAYTQAIGTKNLDASLLQLITLNYLDPSSDRAKNHLIALEKALMSESGLFYRYKHQDDFGKPKSTFLICAYWYVEALACVGRIDEAKERFEYLSQFSNHLGLLSEDVEESNGSQWGNFPQTYSHVGLMNSAFRIAHKLDIPDFLSS